MSQSQVNSVAPSNTCATSLSPSDSISQQDIKAYIRKDHKIKKSNINVSQLAKSFFGQTMKDGKKMCQVPMCGVSLKINKDTKTNLVNHVQKKHPEQWEEALVLGNKHISSPHSKISFGNQSLLHTSLIQNISDKTKQQQFEESLLSFIIVNLLSFQLIESKYFQDMIHGRFIFSAPNR